MSDKDAYAYSIEEALRQIKLAISNALDMGRTGDAATLVDTFAQVLKIGKGYTPRVASAENPLLLSQDEMNLCKGRMKIDAIKAYRQRTGQGLKEAKDAVEAYCTKHGI